MDSTTKKLLTQQELAIRWGRSEAAIQMAAAVGVGPRYIKVDGAVQYPFEEIQRYERACLFFEPGDVALRSWN